MIPPVWSCSKERRLQSAVITTKFLPRIWDPFCSYSLPFLKSPYCPFLTPRRVLFWDGYFSDLKSHPETHKSFLTSFFFKASKPSYECALDSDVSQQWQKQHWVIKYPLSLKVRYLVHCTYKSAASRGLFVGDFPDALVFRRLEGCIMKKYTDAFPRCICVKLDLTSELSLPKHKVTQWISKRMATDHSARTWLWNLCSVHNSR